MHPTDIARLLDIGLDAPGVDGVAAMDILTKARLKDSVTGTFNTQNRGAYFTDTSTIWSDFGAWSPNDKPPNSVPFYALRQKFQISVIDKLIVLRRTMQMRRIAKLCIVPGKHVGFRVVHKRYDDPDFVVDDGIKRRCREMEDLIDNVSREIHRDFQQFAATAAKEELVIDRKAMLRFLDPRTGKPVRYNLVDAATIFPRVYVLLPFMRQNSISDQQFAAEQLSQELYSRGVRDAGGGTIDLTRAAWVQKINDNIVGAWSTAEMDVDIVNRDIELDNLLFGKSSFEQSLELTDMFMQAWMYNMNLFTPNFPENIMVVRGAYDARALENFRRQLLQNTTSAGLHRLPILPGDDKDFDIEIRKIRDTPREAQFEELMRMVIALKCGAYGMHPSEINFAADGPQGSSLDEKSEEMSQEQATEDGFESVAENLRVWLTNALIHPHYPDLQMIWDGLNRESEQRRLALRVQRLATFETLAEARASENLPPLDIPKDLSKLDITKLPHSPVVATLLTVELQAQQMAMQESMMAQQQMAGQQGPPDMGQEGKQWQNAGREEQPDLGEEEPDWHKAGLPKPEVEAKKSRAGSAAYLRLVVEEPDAD